MRFMFTTALASAVMFAGPALAGGDKVEGTTGMTAPESSAAQLHGHSADAGVLNQNFASAGFTDWRPADDAQIFRMQSGDGQPLWVLLMPENFQVGSADETGISGQGDQMAASSGSQADVGVEGMPQRGEQADISDTFEGSGTGERQDMAQDQDLPGTGGQPDLAEAPDLPQPSDQALAEGQDPGAGGQSSIAEGPDVSEPGISGETEPEGFAAQIPGELRSGLESAGFQQVESVDGADLFHAQTADGRQAFIIVGDLGGAGIDQQQAPSLDQQAPGLDQQPGAAPTIPDIAPGNVPEPSPQGQQQ